MDRRPSDTPRSDVYAALDSERDYQDSRWNAETTTSEGKHSLEEWIVYMENYLAEAKQILSRLSTQIAHPQALGIIRKVTAMGVACMEQHGAPQRAGHERNSGQATLHAEFLAQHAACKALVAELISQGKGGHHHETVEAVARANTWKEAAERLLATAL